MNSQTRDAHESRTRIVDALLSVTIAPACAACKRPLEQPTTGPVCASCWSAITPLKPPLCRTCGGMLPSWRTIDRATGRCASCRRRGPSAVDAGSTAGNYEGVLREIVHAFKYEGRRSLAPHLGALMRTAGRELLDGASCVVPVPLYPWRRFSRGFNQASDLARTLHLPVVHALWRSRATASQTGLTASARRRNVRGAFRLSPWVTRRSRDAMLLDRVVVLVDDVRTTGATLEACAKTLKDAGVREVRALTAVRADTPSHRPRIISI